MKKCRTCKEEKPESKFYSRIPDCKKCVSVARHKRYVTDITYYINNRYNALKQRAEGRSVYPTGAVGKPLLTREEFLEWFKESRDEFDILWSAYVESGYSLTLAPSVDRIKSGKGYEIGNLQWLTQSDNSSKRDRD